MKSRNNTVLWQRTWTILLDAGLQLEKVNGWGPGIELIEQIPQWANEWKRPMFFFVRASKAFCMKSE